MTKTLTINSVDVTDKFRLDSMSLEMKAIMGEVGAGTVKLDDTTGTADLPPAMKVWTLTESDASPTTIAGGYVAERELDRGPLTAGTERQWEPVLEDFNAALGDRLLMGASSKRPEETDYQRVTWLLGTNSLSMLSGAGQVPNTNTVTMGKRNYKGMAPLQVLAECAEEANKNFYVYHNGTNWVLYYDKTGSTESAFTSSLRISDVPSDIDNSVTFGPIDPVVEKDPERIYSTLFVRWARAWIKVTRNATKTTFRRRDKAIKKQRFKKAKFARRWARRALAKLNEEITRVSVAVAVPGSALDQLKAGMRIQIKLRSRGITGFTYFRITGIRIEPRIGEGGNPNDDYLVTLQLKDKVRPVNLEDDPFEPPGSGGGGTGSGPGGGDDGSSGGGDSVDSTEYVLDDFNRTRDGYPTLLDERNLTSTGDLTHAVLIPDGSDVIGRRIVIFVSSDDANSELLDSLVDDHGFSAMWSSGDFSRFMVYRDIDGEELDGAGYPATGASVTVTTSVNVAGYFRAKLYEGVGLIEWAADGSADPPSLNPSWDTATLALWWAVGMDDAAISGGDSGYTTIESLGGATSLWVKQKKDDSNTEDPTAWTMSGTAQTSATVAQESLGGWGEILQGDGVDTEAPWEGGNQWFSSVDTGAATIAVDGTHGTITATADDTQVTMTLKTDSPDDANGQPWGPWAEADGVFTFEFQVNFQGDTGDTDPNTIDFAFKPGDSRPGVIVHLGDNVSTSYSSAGLRGIVLYSGSTFGTFVTKTINATTDYKLKVDTRGDTIRAKLWASSAAEPVAWDATLAKVDETVADLADLDIVFSANTTPGNMKVSFNQILASLGGEKGGTITTNLPPGDGSTTTWTVEPFADTPTVWVDGLLTVVTFDRDAGTITFDRAPANGATIRIRYTA